MDDQERQVFHELMDRVSVLSATWQRHVEEHQGCRLDQVAATMAAEITEKMEFMYQYLGQRPEQA